MTADGAQQLRMRLAELKQNPQNQADEVADLQGMLDAATIVEPRPDADSKAVVFGARVTLRQPDGGLETYRIVGVDEANLEPGNVSWVSPLGKALLAATVGQTVRVAPGNAPLGTVVRVR